MNGDEEAPAEDGGRAAGRRVPATGRLDTLIVLAVCLVAYCVLRQGTFYGVDGWADLRRLAADDARSSMHLLYKPGLALVRWIASGFGLSLYESATLFSAIGTAFGVAFVHAATRRLGLRRGQALLCAALCGTAPGVFFYATVVERHGPFFAYAGLAALAAAWLAASPGYATAVALGLAIALSYAAHSTGALLAVAFVPLALAWAARPGPDRRGEEWRKLLPLGGVAVAVAAAGILLARSCGLWSGQTITSDGNLAFLLQHADAHLRQPENLPRNVWQEWLFPFLPMSVLWLGAFLRRRERGLAVAMLGAFFVYQSFAFAILGGFDERGAYLLPLVWPAALLTVLSLPASVSATAVCVALTLAVVQIRAHDDHHHRLQQVPIDMDEMFAGYQEVVGERRAYLLVADPVDFELLFRYLPAFRPNADYFDGIEAGEFEMEAVRRGLPLLEQLLRQKLEQGDVVLITAGAERYLEHPRFTERWQAGPAILEHLRQKFRLERVAARGFEGIRLYELE